ncbi:uncharacterized protein LOC116287898 [Actinia tenebrosa]|uniref:Uncharacterized protein LOC116287898 n=1 Tax=Actinia tenebrosa TaxID=6105 RepID=A0A6P8H4I9_ACTTE|nr:uncharacterized protein LOC116287898 [Actinia tenebrosa]
MIKFTSFIPKNIRLSKPFCLARFWSQKKEDSGADQCGSYIKEGYLWKMKDGLPSRMWRWKKRYLVLSEDSICFLKEKGKAGKTPKIVRILDVVSLMIEDFGIRRKTFGIRLKAGNDRDSFLLRCRSEDERNDWVTAVLTAKSASLLTDES